MNDFAPKDRVKDVTGSIYEVAAVLGDYVWIYDPKKTAPFPFTMLADNLIRVGWEKGFYVHNSDDGITYEVVYVFKNGDGLFVWTDPNGEEFSSRVYVSQLQYHKKKVNR